MHDGAHVFVWNESLLVQMMAFHLLEAKPLLEPMANTYELNTVKFEFIVIRLRNVAFNSSRLIYAYMGQ